MTLAVVVMASLILALLTADHRSRPLALAGAFLLRIGLPSIVGDISVSSSALHASTILILAYSVVWPMATQRTRFTAQNPPPHLPNLCHVVVGMVAGGAIMMSGSPSAMRFAAGLVLNQVVAPYIFCVLIYNASCHDESLQKNAARLFASFCVFESLIALAVNFHTIAQPYLSAYSSVASWISLDTRQPATLDHPLALGLFLAAGIPMAAYFKSRLTTYLAIFVIVAGISVTQSRIAIVGALVGILYLLTIGSKSSRGRIALLVAAGVGYTVLNTSGIFQGLLDRIQDDEGSSRARSQAAQLFINNWRDFKVTGVGMEFGKEYFLSRGLRSSGESAAICYAVGIGIPLTLLYFSLIIWMISSGIRRANNLSPASAAAIIVFGSIQFYSSIATESAAGMMLWATIGIAIATPQSVVRSRMRYVNPRILEGGSRMERQPPSSEISGG